MLKLASERLMYRPLTHEDVTETYINWLNDSTVNRYLEVKYMTHTLDTCRQFVEEMNNDPKQYLFGIFLQDGERHIGNIKLHLVYEIYDRAQLSLFIGEAACWGKGYATEAISAISKWGFNEKGLKKIEAGCHDVNIGSLRSFLKAGYQVEGYIRSGIELDGNRIGSFWMGALPNEIK